jgi:signal transduction histidine kinase
MLLKEIYEVFLASSVGDALKVLDQNPVDLIITDIRMPGQTGMDLLRQVKMRNPDIQVILLTGYGQLQTAMEAMDHGAFAYLEKPFDNDTMLRKVQACLEAKRFEQERRSLEHLAMEANQFETLGRLVSGTLHDLATPLSVIGANLEVIGTGKSGEDLTKRLDTMREQVNHCTDLVRTTMNFLRHAPKSSQPFCLNDVVEICLKVGRPLFLSHNVTIKKGKGQQAYTHGGELVMVRQAILNLLYNACQAMETQAGERVITVDVYRDEDHCHVVITDNGPGIPETNRDRIFDPLFSTKGNKGTGLGLAVVKNVMVRHAGSVELEVQEGPGARFHLRFPVAHIEDK